MENLRKDVGMRPYHNIGTNAVALRIIPVTKLIAATIIKIEPPFGDPAYLDLWCHGWSLLLNLNFSKLISKSLNPHKSEKTTPQDSEP